MTHNNTSTDVNAMTQKVLNALDDLKARDVTNVDLKDKADFADRMIVASGTSNRHVKALAQEVCDQIKASFNEKPLGIEGIDSGEWVLVDYGHIIIHVMLPATRDFYELERLWTARPEQSSQN